MNAFFLDIPSLRRGIDTADPSGKFCNPIPIANMIADTGKATAKDISQTRDDFKNLAHRLGRPTEGQNTDITVGSEGTKSGTSDNNPIRDRTRNL